MLSLTKKAIMESFVKLLEEKPLNKISVKDVVEDCGINRNTFYYHFADLPSLIDEIIKAEADQIMKDFGGAQSLEDCLNAAVEMSRKHRTAIYHIYQSANRDIFEQYLLEICEYVAGSFVRNAAGQDADPEDVTSIVQFYKCECFGQVIDWLNHGMSTDIQAQFFRLCELHKGMTDEMLRRSTNK